MVSSYLKDGLWAGLIPASLPTADTVNFRSYAGESVTVRQADTLLEGIHAAYQNEPIAVCLPSGMYRFSHRIILPALTVLKGADSRDVVVQLMGI